MKAATRFGYQSHLGVAEAGGGSGDSVRGCAHGFVVHFDGHDDGAVTSFRNLQRIVLLRDRVVFVRVNPVGMNFGDTHEARAQESSGLLDHAGHLIR